MNANGRFLLVALLLVLADLPWLSLLGGQYSAIVQAIQGGSQVRMRPLAGIVVYPALAYLLLQATSVKQAFLIGMSVYAVYDFTVLAAFDKYPLWIAVSDTLWGGVLFSLVYTLMTRFFKA